ncbi:hypothetical protein N7468_009916 [Penicillium chermesinum]|uniref:Uncharacterized protein n=1 Tax=Penicillium chermesinum TaxID=63820 RepID=A0A9W9NDK4_9EURO|nr:uncharacterized protein N7468_009916 [Penicillium chermesinum]KAJ5216908.1 hypothetical protein N7468_009916 [Penicillium chermesinum]
MSLTIDAFLDPQEGPEATEFLHTLAFSAHGSSDDSRYSVLGQIRQWGEFDSSNLASNSQIRSILDLHFTPKWKPWLPDLARVIHNERQLEHLYHITLITRVNIALQRALSPGNCVTVVVCPGSFDSYDPHSIDGKETVILPDWIAIEGDYSPHDGAFPPLETLARQRKIIAVGDTKLVRLPSNFSSQSERTRYAGLVDGTHSCRRSYLAQVQHYACMLYTRFAFVLTNKELLLAQFLQEREATPRLDRERGLRSGTGFQTLEHGLSSDFRTSEPTGKFQEPTSGGKPLHTPHSRPKRRNMSGETPSRQSPAVSGNWAGDEGFELASSLSTSPPASSQMTREQVVDAASKLVPSPSRHPPEQSSSSTYQFPLTSPESVISPLMSRNRSSSLTYAPSERDNEIGEVLVQSIRVPNLYDPDSVVKNKQAVTHPAKALFALLMLAYLVGPQGRSIGTEEIGFGSLLDQATR